MTRGSYSMTPLEETPAPYSTTWPGTRNSACSMQSSPASSGVDHRLLRPAVGGREPAEAVGRLDGGPELLRAVRRVVGDVPGGRAARRHDLDVVGAFRDELPDGGPDRVEAVGHPVAPVEVAVAVGHRPAAQEEARSDEVAAVDRLADDERHAVPAAVVPERRHAAREVALEVADRDQGHHLVRVEHHLLVRPAVAGQGEVSVGVDEARHAASRRRTSRRRRPGRSPSPGPPARPR